MWQALCQGLETLGQTDSVPSLLGAAQGTLNQPWALEPPLIRNKSLPYINSSLLITCCARGTMLCFIGDTNTQSPYLQTILSIGGEPRYIDRKGKLAMKGSGIF